ncbi:YALI0F27731p [Yarrowia lipolytica CLIB122]|uniref:YALI0F27731p n=2 Tax=Yarrowia lipolytica TaxID=4952 RepID=Q6C052_YARLI|nr:YALI0F27731p [Yarrowia lipolytica CLIB122]AOW07798.1 hypothetical protein YALI1_F35274g [Yarrowia lipolytica]KAB8284598.1 hypothetical protein BKA91DRAFT_4881 [Yarrowia lipolytica]KAE8174361.1 hypothetical protein BKA90DRAFT_36965 [Yarrowia lipolytica]KAJ8055153.1 hypothetical protein LXG23DRAFT_47208 [Yarrowia lipolytica]RMI99931.1 hypothetical protein BD777DRAFT_18934 [Yarrowia lipolytica]|eukprot:XP_505960.1 YALI0F27731p [Yarrowia lipolytica CLIB122]
MTHTIQNTRKMKSFDLSRISRSLSFNNKQGTYPETPETDPEYFHTSIKPTQSEANTIHTTCARPRTLIAASCNKIHNGNTSAVPKITQSAPVSPQMSSINAQPWPELDLEIPALVPDSSSRDTSLSRIKSHDHLEVPLGHHHVSTIDEDRESMLSLTPTTHQQYHPHQYPMPVRGDLRCPSFVSRDSMDSARDYPCFHEPVFDVEFDNSSPLEGINPLNRVAQGSLVDDQQSVNLGPIKPRPEIKPLVHASTFTEDLVRFPSELVKLPNKINKKVKHRSSKLIKRPQVNIDIEELDSELERFETATNTACVENVESHKVQKKNSKKVDKKNGFNRMMMKVIRPFKSS